MDKVKVPLNKGLFELRSGRQLVPGEVEKLSKDEAKENEDLIKGAIKDGLLLEITEEVRSK